MLFPNVLHSLKKEVSALYPAAGVDFLYPADAVVQVLEAEYTLILKILLDPPSGPVYAAYLGPK